MLVVAHREELLHQAVAQILRMNPTLAVDIEQADKHASDEADVVIASVQTLSARGGRRLARFDPDKFRIVAIDECHHSTAPTYRSVIEYFGMLPPPEFRPLRPETSYKAALQQQRLRLKAWDRRPVPDRLLLGLTATPFRGDRLGLEAVFQSIVYTKTLQEMIRENFLCRLKAIRVQTTTRLDEVKILGGDFNQKELSHVVNILARNRLAVQAYRDKGEGRRAVVFCADVDHAKTMAATFRSNGIEARSIDGTMSGEERKPILDDFRNRKFLVLANVSVLTEGWDDPGVDCIIHARPTKSSLWYIQASGRGSRLFPGKTDCLIIDVVDATKRHSLVTLPSLFGLPVGFDFKDQDVLDVVDQVAAIHAEKPTLVGLSLDELRMKSEIVNLFAATDEMIEQYAEYTWCKVEGRYVLSLPTALPGMLYLDLRENPYKSWDVVFHLVPPARAHILATAMSLKAAFSWAEQWYIQRVKEPCNRLHRRDQARYLRSVTAIQRAQLKTFGLVVPKTTTWATTETMLNIINADPEMKAALMA
jgi:superfamily II DNA or RNA helicase